MSAKYYLLVLLLPVSLSIFPNPYDEKDSVEAKLSQLKGVEHIKALLVLSESYRNTAFNDCLKYGIKAAQLANRENENDLEAQVYKSLGNSCYFHGELDMGNDYYRKGLYGFQGTNNLQGQANCLNNIGLIFEETSRFDSAQYYYQKSLDIESQIGNKRGIGISLLQLGNLSYYRDELQNALDNYYRAMLIFKDENDSTSLALSYNSMGIIYREWSLFDKALGYYQLAIPILEQTGDDRSLSQVLTNMGEIFNFELKDYQKARQFYDQSLRLKHKMNDKIGIALLNNNLGTLYANMKDTSNALRHFKISKRLYEEFQGETGLIMVLYNMGSLFLDNHQYDRALPYFLQSLKMAEDFKYVEFIRLNQVALMNSYAALGKYELYQNYFKLLALDKDSLIERLNVLQSRESEGKFRTEEVLEEAEKLQISNELKEAEIRKYKLMLAGISALFFFTLMGYALYTKLKKHP
ncbi:MAG: hypothetical protein CVT99_08125 [Bacteroidetes bacterium HGW-Bacteroidetes-16]|jgi:tetratricopeptide (TPR) repeat protein|nr:MAG: hypothetical protein CVT99_08125 [Bacteroidetes bacterium HGW-Bacteroidetes-16]